MPFGSDPYTNPADPPLELQALGPVYWDGTRWQLAAPPPEESTWSAAYVGGRSFTQDYLAPTAYDAAPSLTAAYGGLVPEAPIFATAVPKPAAAAPIPIKTAGPYTGLPVAGGGAYGDIAYTREQAEVGGGPSPVVIAAAVAGLGVLGFVGYKLAKKRR